MIVRRLGLLGMTLIELLVVLVVVTTLAAVTLPAFKSVLVERKTSVASLEVRAFLESARARAISRGLPVSVILERLSSRTDGFAIGGGAVGALNPRRSITAENPPLPLPVAWQPGDINTNFDQYNTCIRMVMAETIRPTEFESLPPFAPIVHTETSAGIPPAIRSQLDDNDGLFESDRIIEIANRDPRLAINLNAGNEIEVIGTNDRSYRFLITYVVNAGGSFFINIRNEGTATTPFGSALSTRNDINRMGSDQTIVHPYVPISASAFTISGFRIHARPRPIASLNLELPKGTCIDLSLSGLESDDPLVNPVVATPTFFSMRRDCRREFASDWISATISSMTPPGIAMPHQLRPVFLTFSPNGSLANVYTNAPDAPDLRRIDPPSDVCLFVGRNDQLLQALTKADLSTALSNKIKPNLLDSTAFWVRISPSSGAITTAPALVAAIEASAVPAATTVGELLSLSRQGLFSNAQTSQ